MPTTNPAAAAALLRYQDMTRDIPGLKNRDGSIRHPPAREAFSEGFIAGWTTREADAAAERRVLTKARGDQRTAFETQLMIELRETREDFAMMTAEATRLEEEIELRSAAEVDAALRIAYLEERVLELQLALRRATVGAWLRERDSATPLGWQQYLAAIMEVLGAVKGETAIDAAARAVRERDAAIASYANRMNSDAASRSSRLEIEEQMRTTLGAVHGESANAAAVRVAHERDVAVATHPQWSSRPEVMLRRVVEGRQIDAAAEARKQEQQIRDADLRTIHARLVAHGARVPEGPVFDAIMAGISDLGDRASRTMPGSMARAGGEAKLIADLIDALGLYPDIALNSSAEIVRWVRENRDGRASLARALDTLRQTLASALGLTAPDLCDSDLVAAVQQQHADLEQARARDAALEAELHAYRTAPLFSPSNADLAEALGWSRDEDRRFVLLAEVRSIRTGRENLTRTLNRLRIDLMGALGITSGGPADNTGLIDAARQQREGLEAARAQLDAVERKVAGFAGATVAEKVHAQALALTEALIGWDWAIGYDDTEARRPAQSRIREMRAMLASKRAAAPGEKT